MNQHRKMTEALASIGALRHQLPAGVAVRADSGQPTNTEIKQLIEEGNRAYSEFKAQVERRLKDVEEKGHADPITEEVLGKINGDMDRILETVAAYREQQERLDDLEARMNRGGLGGAGTSGGRVTDEHVRQFNAFLADELHRGREPGMNAQQVAAYKTALMQYARLGQAMPSDVRAELSVGEDPAGGFWVTPDMDGRIVQFLYETSAVRQDASVETIGTESLQGDYDLDEAGFGWVGEKETRSETDTPELGEWEIFTHEMYALPQATQKMLDDAMRDVEAWLTDKIRRRFARAEETAFINGNGVKKPRGILTYTTGTTAPSASDFKKVEHVTTGANGAFNGTDPANVFIEAQAALKTGYRGNAVWAMNRATLGETMKLQDGQGMYLLVPDFSQGRRTLLGHPVREWDDMPDIAANSLSIAFGDFREAYQIVDRHGVRLLRDPYTTKGKVKFYATRRVGGDVVNFEAFKLVKFTA